jgi:ribosome-binding factor A
LSVSKPEVASRSQECLGFPETRIREFAIRDARLRVSVIVVSAAVMAGLSHAAVFTVLNDAAGTELDELSLKQMNFSTETPLKYLYTAISSPAA